MPPARILLAVWLLALALLAIFVSVRLQLSSDLRLFMPKPQNAEQRLLIDEIGEGPGARLLLLAIEGGSPQALAETSQSLLESLGAAPQFRQISNGSSSLEAFPEALLPYRYLLSPGFDSEPLDAGKLGTQLQQRVQDLNSPAASLLKPWVRRDPTLEVMQLFERWRPQNEPERALDVWMSADQTRALLVVETRAAGFDPHQQAEAIAAIEQAFADTRSEPGLRLLISGPGAFANIMQQRTAGEASRLGVMASLGMMLLMLFAYRRARFVLLGALPMVSAGLAGLAAVSALFGDVHGITLAFGFTLIGVAQDYPMHLFSHQHRGISPRENARALWPTLATGVASTCIAYLAFLFSGVTGLAQLACFSMVGVAVAGLCTRLLMPALLGDLDAGAADSPRLARLLGLSDRLPRPRWLVPALALGAVMALLLGRGPLFENNLAALTPLPADLLQRDIELRQQLGAPDVRHMLVLRDHDEEALLQRSERLIPDLQALVAAGTISGFDLAARYLPSVATQRQRQSRLPDALSARLMLDQATQGKPFRAGIFEPFLDDLERARSADPLRVSDLRDTPLALRVDSLLRLGGDDAVALVSLAGVHDTGALSRFSARHAGVQWLDLKQTSEQLVIEYRERILISLLLAAVLLIAVIAGSLRAPARVARVLLPMALSSLLVPALLHLVGVPLSLFHLIALVLAAGLGLDYALFFEHAESDPAAQRRTLHALLVCAASTLMVFALLASASIPVLRAIGLTVSLGVVCNFVLAAMFARRPSGVSDAARS